MYAYLYLCIPTANKVVATSRATCRLSNVPKAVVNRSASCRQKHARSVARWSFQQPSSVSKAGRTLVAYAKKAAGTPQQTKRNRSVQS
eukprot:4276826-Pyramimonas_sp.AAC.1